MRGLLRKSAFVVATLAVAVSGGFAVAQQGSPKLPFVVRFGLPTTPEMIDAFYQGLADYGYVNGRNISVEVVTGPTNDLPLLAAKVVASKPDVVVLTGAAAAHAVADAGHNTVPMVAFTDLLGEGFVESLGRPGGNITGISTFIPDLIGRQLAVLRESVPALRRLAIFNVLGQPVLVKASAATAAAAMALGIEAAVIDLDDSKDFASQFAGVVASGAQAAFIPNSNYFVSNQQLLCDLLIKNRLASLFASGQIPLCGLLTYGPNNAAEQRKFGSYVDAILKGSKPADLPVQQPTAFDFVVNLSTARSLGLAIPSQVLAQATQVIE